MRDEEVQGQQEAEGEQRRGPGHHEHDEHAERRSAQRQPLVVQLQRVELKAQVEGAYSVNNSPR